MMHHSVPPSGRKRPEVFSFQGPAPFKADLSEKYPFLPESQAKIDQTRYIFLLLDIPLIVWYIVAMKGNQAMDIRKHRFVPAINTATRIIVDKKRKAKTRRYLNNPKNWENFG